MITLVFASDPNGIIGNKGKLPWPTLKGDLKRFKEITMGGTVVMGRNTFESLPNGPLIGRHNIVLTKNITLQDRWKAFKFNIKNLLSDTSLEFENNFNDVVDDVRNEKFNNVFVIGGASIYRQMEHCCDRMIWTQVKEAYEGDTKFIPSKIVWQKITETDRSEYKILTFRKKW